jgi:hypothetical protein
MNTIARLSAPLLLTVLGYIFFNIAVIESGHSTLNLGLMNAGVVACIIFRHQLKAWPRWGVSVLGALGILAIVYGLRWTHAALQDPANVMEVIYDLVVFTSVGLWMVVERPLGLQPTKVNPFDVVLHVIMACLVLTRLQIHWQDGWEPITFLPAGLAVIGYWLFNVSVRVAQKEPKSTRSTNVTMNVIAGLALCCLAFVEGGAATTLSWVVVLGIFALVLIVYFIGRSYAVLGPMKMAPFVMVGIYDGLLIFAPLAMLLVYATPYSWKDVAITAGFIAVMATRLLFYRRLATR